MFKIILKKASSLVVPGLLAFFPSYSLFIYGIQNNTPFFSKRYFITALIFFCILTFLFSRINIHRNVQRLTRMSKTWLILVFSLNFVLAFFVCRFFILNLPTPKVNPFLYPEHRIDVIPLDERNAAASGDIIEILYFNTAFGYNSFAQFETDGSWFQTDSGTFLINEANPNASISWKGRPGGQLYINFNTGPNSGFVKIAIDGQEILTLDLYSDVPGIKQFGHTFPAQHFEQITNYLAVYLSFLLIISSATYLLLTAKIHPVYSEKKKAYWLVYAIPMILVWGTALLAVWPGLLSADSLDQVYQARSGSYNDWHSVLYTVIIRGALVLSGSPAAVALLQIISLAVVVAWGLRFFDLYGSPPWLPWLVSILMAFSLPNMLTINTLWKDIPYSISVVFLTLICMAIVYSKGEWLSNKGNILMLGLVACLVILFRQNGLFVPVGTLILLTLLYRKQWKALLSAFLIMLIGVAVFTGPVYKLLNVNTVNKSYIIIIHHLGAYIKAGAPLTPAEKEFIVAVQPEDIWQKYDCATVNPLIFNESFRNSYFNENIDFAAQALRRLFLANPMISFKHMLCSSSMIWRVQPESYLYISAYDLNTDREIAPNQGGIVSKSRLPYVRAALFRWFRFLEGEKGYLYILTWRPAIFLYGAILLGGLLLQRQKNLSFVCIIAPLVIHSGTLLLVNIAQDARYQYPAYLIFLFFLGFLFMPAVEKDTQLEHKEP